MQQLLRTLFGGLVVMAIGAVGDAQAQAPPPVPIEGNIYSVTYVEVMPTAKADAVTLLRRYREAARKEGGNLRCEVVQRIDQPHQFAIFEIWKDPAAFEAHGKSANTTDTREKIAAIRNAPTDERVHIGLSIGPIDTSVRGAVYVATHVDVIPPRKDDGVAALKRLGDESRRADGNLRFEVVQQINRQNHFTVVEIWKEPKAAEAHSMAPATREFRDKLATMTGALYDERMYRAID
ncbi:MAG TPA: antibiotic biosynthesis monooxygenase [Candidatus Binatia bacterium]|nr:antibiotic biosynthesis monooxygenase [Candidatus Binatia bacterium]